MQRNTIDCAEALAYAQSLPDNSVHCIVTSPPYYGLRSYRTERWDGGDPKCDHLIPTEKSKTPRSPKQTTPIEGRPSQFKETCRKCGAVRIDEQIGLEITPELYISRLVEVFREYRRVLRQDGTLWVVIGDSYWGGKGQSGSGGKEYQQMRCENGSSYTSPEACVGGSKKTRPTDRKSDIYKSKDLMLIPAQLAIALRADGWWLRDEIIWNKPNGMPSSMQDRTSRCHETIWMLSKSKTYFYDQEAIKQPAAEATAPRAQRGISPDHKNANGVPGQTTQSMQRSRPNVRKQDGVGNRQYTGFNERWDNAPVEMVNPKSVWTVATVAGMDGHYATFPPNLIEKMILAGCPHKTCSQCGSPWVRIVEKGNAKHNGATSSSYATGSGANRLALLMQAARENGGEYTNVVRTVGWKPTCTCNAETQPGIVLDPFLGSGTTARVAVSLGRDYLGCDLNEEYVEMARESLKRGIQMPLIEVLQA